MNGKEYWIYRLWQRFRGLVAGIVSAVFGSLFGWKVGLILGIISSIAAAFFFVGPIPNKIDRFIRVKILRIEHESGLEQSLWDQRQEELVRQQEEQRRVAELEARLESRHYTQAEIDSLIRTTQMGDEEKTRLRKKYLGKRSL